MPDSFFNVSEQGDQNGMVLNADNNANAPMSSLTISPHAHK